METKIRTVIITLILFYTCPAGAVIWTEGYHQMVPGESYGESAIYNDVRLDIYGGSIIYVVAYDSTITNWYDGQMNYFAAGGNSIVNIYGGFMNRLDIGENAILNLNAKDVQYHPTGGYWNGGWIEGKYLNNNYFDFDVRNENALSHITVVPEPSTLFLLGLGCLLLRRKK
jgi:hypothetical protein